MRIFTVFRVDNLNSSVTIFYIFFFNQKTAYYMRISDWSSDVCSSDLFALNPFQQHDWLANAAVRQVAPQSSHCPARLQSAFVLASAPPLAPAAPPVALASALSGAGRLVNRRTSENRRETRSEEHTSELQSLMRISYAVFCLKKTNKTYTPKQIGK